MTVQSVPMRHILNPETFEALAEYARRLRELEQIPLDLVAAETGGSASNMASVAQEVEDQHADAIRANEVLEHCFGGHAYTYDDATLLINPQSIKALTEQFHDAAQASSSILLPLAELVATALECGAVPTQDDWDLIIPGMFTDPMELHDSMGHDAEPITFFQSNNQGDPLEEQKGDPLGDLLFAAFGIEADTHEKSQFKGHHGHKNLTSKNIAAVASLLPLNPTHNSIGRRNDRVMEFLHAARQIAPRSFKSGQVRNILGKKYAAAAATFELADTHYRKVYDLFNPI